MKVFKKILLWVAVSVLAMWALIFIPSVSTFVALALIALILPIDAWQNIVQRFIKRKLKTIIAIVLAVVTLFTIPGMYEETADSNIDVAVTTTSTISTTSMTTDKETEATTKLVTTTTEEPETTTQTTTVTETTTTTKKTTVSTTKKTTTSKATTTTTKRTTTKTTEADVQDIMVWIPTNGGTKYHSKSTCSKMKNPDYVTLEEAEDLGFTPCGRCYK